MKKTNIDLYIENVENVIKGMEESPEVIAILRNMLMAIRRLNDNNKEVMTLLSKGAEILKTGQKVSRWIKNIHFLLDKP